MNMVMVSPSKLPNFAVLLAAYEGERWIEEQIMSILNQIGVKVSIFVSVDLSSDRTIKILNGIVAQNSQVHLLPYGDRFGSAGANFFRLIRDVDLAGFDFVSFSDQDDIWYQDKLSIAARKICEGSVSAYSSDVRAFWENGRTRYVKKSYPQTRYDHYFEAAGPGCTYVITLELAQNLKIFLENSPNIRRSFPLHDWLFYCYARANGYKWYIDDQPCLAYRQHSSNVIGINYGLKSYFRRFHLLKQGWYNTHVHTLLNEFPLPEVSREFTKTFLILNFFKIRRRNRDKLLILLMVIVGFV